MNTNPNSSPLLSCQHFILEQNISQAIGVLFSLLRQQPPANNTFRGSGNIEDWQLFFPGGPLQWLKAALEKKEILNPFDLLNLCFCIRTHSKTATITYLLRQYSKLEKYLGPRLQLTMGRGHVYYQDEQYLQALKCYQAVVEEKGQWGKVLECLAWTQFRLARKNYSLQYAQRCIRVDHNNLGAIYLWVVYGQERVRRAELLRLLKLHPHYYRAHVGLGNCSPTLKEALLHYQEVLSHEPRSASILAKIGLAHLELGKDVRQAQYFGQLSLGEDCYNREVYQLLGKIAAAQQDYQLACDHYQQGLALFPHHTPFLLQLAHLYLHQLNCIPEAIQLLHKYSQLNPFCGSVYYDLGFAQSQLGNLAEATLHFEKALDLDPAQVQVLLNLAQLEEQQQHYPRAVSFYSQLLELEVQPVCLYGLAHCFLMMQDFPSAEQWALKCREVDESPYNEQACLLLGDISFRGSQATSALLWYLQYQNIVKSFSLSDKLRNWISSLATRQKVVREAWEKIGKKRESVYGLVVLAQIMAMLLMDEESHLAYQTAAAIQQRTFVSMELEQLLANLHHQPSP